MTFDFSTLMAVNDRTISLTSLRSTTSKRIGVVLSTSLHALLAPIGWGTQLVAMLQLITRPTFQ